MNASQTEKIDLTSVPGVSGTSARLNGYLARPSGEGPWPGVVLLFEAFGVDDVMKQHAQRLAEAGFLVLMPDLYSDGGARRCLVSTFSSLLSGKGRAYRDIEAARVWLESSKECTGKVGSLGFCMGGGFALITASRGFDAASVNYGVLPRNLAEIAGQSCPIVGSYGAKDISLRGAAAKLEKQLNAAGVVNDVAEYPGAGHSFLNDEPNGPALLRPVMTRIGIGPNEAAAAQAWPRILGFLRQHLA